MCIRDRGGRDDHAGDVPGPGQGDQQQRDQASDDGEHPEPQGQAADHEVGEHGGGPGFSDVGAGQQVGEREVEVGGGERGQDESQAHEVPRVDERLEVVAATESGDDQDDQGHTGVERGDDELRRPDALVPPRSAGGREGPGQDRVHGHGQRDDHDGDQAGALGLVSIMIIPLAVSVHSVLAWAFASTGRPWWHESIWAPQFVVAALYSGVALVILVVAGFRRGYHLESFIHPRHFVRLGFILATFAATYLYLTFADLLPGSYVGEPGPAAVFTDLMVGRLALWFWMFAVVGGLIPLLLVALPWTRNVTGMVIAATLVLPMMWLKRVLLVVGPATYDTVTRTFGTYHFTWVPITITLAAAAAVPLLLMLLFRVVPLLSIDEIEAIDAMQEIDEMEKDQTAHPSTEPSEPVSHDDRLVGTSGTAHRVAGTLGVLLLVALLGMLGVGTAHPAQAATPQSASVVTSLSTSVRTATGAPTITIKGVEGGGKVQLTATLTGANGQPQTDAPVAFSFSTT